MKWSGLRNMRRDVGEQLQKGGGEKCENDLLSCTGTKHPRTVSASKSFHLNAWVPGRREHSHAADQHFIYMHMCQGVMSIHVQPMSLCGATGSLGLGLCHCQHRHRTACMGASSGLLQALDDTSPWISLSLIMIKLQNWHCCSSPCDSKMMS